MLTRGIVDGEDAEQNALVMCSPPLLRLCQTGSYDANDIAVHVGYTEASPLVLPCLSVVKATSHCSEGKWQGSRTAVSMRGG
jgi:hypothetical protein